MPLQADDDATAPRVRAAALDILVVFIAAANGFVGVVICGIAGVLIFFGATFPSHDDGWTAAGVALTTVDLVVVFGAVFLFLRAAWLATRWRLTLRAQGAPFLLVAVFFAIASVEGVIAKRRIADHDGKLMQSIEALRPRLAALTDSLTREAATDTQGRCRSPVPDLLPECVRDGRKVLLVSAPFPDEYSSGPIDGIAYVPDGEPTESLGGAWIGGLLEPLGAGWYHVRVYPGLD